MTNRQKSAVANVLAQSLIQEVAASFSLNPKEAIVYLAALESGARSVQAIAAAANTERTGTYDVLERLAKRGIIRLERVGKHTTIHLEPPDTIRKKLNAQLTAVDVVLPQLNALYNQTVDNFSVERGVGAQAFQSMHELIHKGNSPLKLMIGSVSIADQFGQRSQIAALTPLLQGRRTKVLIAKTVSSVTAAWLAELKLILPCRRLPSPALIQTSRLVSSETVITIGMESEELTAIVVTSPTNAAHESVLFDALWRIAKPIV